MINDMKEKEGEAGTMAETTTENQTTSSRKSHNSSGPVEHQIETEFDLDPLPEREDFHHWFTSSSSSNNDISLTPIRNSVFLASRRVRHPHKSVQVEDSSTSSGGGHVIIPSTGRKTNSVTFAPSFSETSSSVLSTDEGRGDKNCNCTHQIDCSARSSHSASTEHFATSTNSMNPLTILPPLPHFACNNFRDSNDKRGSSRSKGLNSQRRSVSLPEKVWNELVNRSRRRKSKQKLEISASASPSVRSSISPTSAVIEMESESTTTTTTTGLQRNPGIRRSNSSSSSLHSSTSSINNVRDSRESKGKGGHRRPLSSQKIENVSDVTNGESVKTNETTEAESNGDKKKNSRRSKWKFFSKGFPIPKRSRSAGPNSTASPNAVNIPANGSSPVQLRRSESSSDGDAGSFTRKHHAEKNDDRRSRPRTLLGKNEAMASFFRSFRVKKNKVGDGKLKDEVDPDEMGPEISGFANRRKPGRHGVNTSIFSSFYQAGRKHFSPKDLDDVTLDLGSGELMKTKDGTVIEKSDVVDVVTITNEETTTPPSSTTSGKKKSRKKEAKQEAKAAKLPPTTKKEKKKNVLVVAVAMTLPPPKSKSVSSSSSSLSPAQASAVPVTEDQQQEQTERNTRNTNTGEDYLDLYARAESKKNPPPCEILSSSNGGDSSTASSRGSQTEHFPLQHLSEQNQHARQLQEESENSFPQSKSLFGKVKESLGSKSRRRFSHKTSFGNHLNSTSSIPDSPQPQQQSSSHNSNNFDGEGNGENGSNETGTGSTSSYRSKAVDIIGPGGRNSSEEELISITNSQSGGFGSLSLSETEEYMGPFVGKAVALVDCMHSPYDRHALRYKKGDLIEIISKKPSGLWTGKVNGQVGHFKFINVEILPDESDEDEGEDESGSNVYDRSGDHRSRQAHSYLHVRRRNKRMTAMTPWEMEQRQTVANVINGIRKENAALSQHSKSLDSESPFRTVHGRTGRRKSSATTTATATAASLKKGRPKSVGDLLRRINLEEYISVFILHGFESLDLFKELEEEDLDRLAIRNESDRTKILTVVELLREFDSEAEIPPIIIPTYSCPSQLDGIDDREDCDLEGESDLHRIIAPPANFTRTSGAASKSGGTTMVRDSGVFVKCDDQEDPEIEEIILSPINLRVDMSPGRGGSSRSSAQPSVFLGRLTNSNSGHGKQFQVHSHPLSQIKNQMDPQESVSVKSNDSWPENVEQFCAVRQRFLQAKSLFETGAPATSPSGTPQSGGSGDQGQKNRFLFCEKSSDSGISVGANSPPPPTRID